MKERAEGSEPPAGDDDIVRGKAECQPFRRSIFCPFYLGIGIEEIVDELRIREAVDASVAGEEVEHQYGVLGFLDAAGFFLDWLSGSCEWHGIGWKCLWTVDGVANCAGAVVCAGWPGA